MEKARILEKEEIINLPWGGVVWCEHHGEYNCGKYGIVKYYDVFPMMKTFSPYDDDNYILVAGERYSGDIDINNIPDRYKFWSNKPCAEQMEPGLISWEEAAEIYNKSGVI